MATQLESLLLPMAKLTISKENDGQLPLENYFPPSFEIHDYNATENKIITTSSLDDDVKNWLRRRANKNFVFQCLLCCQEMTFDTAFSRGDYIFNRSHLLTKKHKKKVNDALCVGILFVSSQKFIMCLDSILQKGNLFDALKTVKRRSELVISNLIRNKISCSNYSMFTFDRASKSLCEMDTKCDIVDFMISDVRPLFNFHCLLCDIKTGNFTQVVDHLGSKKHKQKLKENKGVIISIKDFNFFVACNLNELSSFLFLEHLNSYLEEIVIASTGTIIISGCHSADGKQAPKEGEITINVKPIQLPDGAIAQKSIRVTTRYNNFLSDSSENGVLNNKLAIGESRINKQENVTIYEYSNQDFHEHCMDNILHALFTIGCKIWCSRCKKGIFTLQALQTHLSSVEHTKNIRNNEQIGFMCHVCKIFFIELKGESLVHTHSSYQNKNIILKLSQGGIKSLEFNTPLNSSIIEAYGKDFLDNIGEACKFCCLACNDFTKQTLPYLGSHEISTRHKNLKKTLIYAKCEYCNVIYIDTKLDNISGQFKLHFAKHLNDNKEPIIYLIYSVLDNYTTCFQSIIDKNFFSFKDIELEEETKSLNGRQKLTVSFSQNFTQFDNPGVSSNEFVRNERWNSDDFSRYLQFYTSLTGERVELFECNICNLKNTTKTEIFRHLFISEHQLNQLYTKESFLKICSICSLAIFSGNLRDLQQHFNQNCHIKALYTVIGLPYTAALTFNETILSSFMNIPRSSLKAIIQRIVCEMKEIYRNRQNIFDHITKDTLALMSNKFPNLSVTFYGSRLSGLAKFESDFDIFLNIDNYCSSFNYNVAGNDNLNKVKDLLSAQNNLFRFVCFIDCAVPIIQAEHKTTGYLCEFNLNNPGKHVKTSKIIKILTDLDERVLWLLAAVKHWSIATKIKGTDMFSSHAITWLTLFYLMQPDLRIIPNISFVIDQCGNLDHPQDNRGMILFKYYLKSILSILNSFKI
ncbi:unnamed protein product [Nezara viridula]|uniref:C2H2-type domain-containing protein n=1 Tax=Nezara viridula TaxID=85310 RepID=A0A9P0MX50_NEZVI|nr:unnamed protein product [Nezara viridula]